MDHKTATYTSVTTRHWHRLFLCAGLLAALGVEECNLGLVSIDSPADGTTFTEAQTVTITASALEGEGLVVEEVRFYHDGARVGTDRTKPYTHRWSSTDRDNGAHRFYAEALYRYGDGKTELLQSEEVVYEVAIEAPPDGGPVARVVGSLQVGPGVIAMDKAGTIAVVASGLHGLSVIDLSDPAHPRAVGRLDLDHRELGVATDKSFAYVVERTPDSGASLAVVDIRDPSTPSFIARLDLPGKIEGRAVSIDGSLAYVAATDAGLLVIDVSQPYRPAIIGTGATSVQATYVHVSDGLAYLGAVGANLSIVDATDPRHPTETFGGRFIVSGIAPVENARAKAVLATRVSLSVWDTSNPSAPKTLGTVDVGGWAMALLRDYAFLAELTELRVVDVSDHSKPEQVQELPVSNVSKLVAAGNLVLAVDRSFKMTVISL